jgi:hypothetical protein
MTYDRAAHVCNMLALDGRYGRVLRGARSPPSGLTSLEPVGHVPEHVSAMSPAELVVPGT